MRFPAKACRVPKTASLVCVAAALLGAVVVLPVPSRAQTSTPATSPSVQDRASTAAAAVREPTADEGAGSYVIGPDDLLSVVFWRDQQLSGDVLVRPDGRISLPLLDDVQAAGLRPKELRERLV